MHFFWQEDGIEHMTDDVCGSASVLGGEEEVSSELKVFILS